MKYYSISFYLLLFLCFGNLYSQGISFEKDDQASFNKLLQLRDSYFSSIDSAKTINEVKDLSEMYKYKISAGLRKSISFTFNTKQDFMDIKNMRIVSVALDEDQMDVFAKIEISGIAKYNISKDLNGYYNIYYGTEDNTNGAFNCIVYYDKNTNIIYKQRTGEIHDTIFADEPFLLAIQDNIPLKILEKADHIVFD